MLAVIVLIDREENDGLQAVQAAAGAGVPVHAIFKKSDLDNAYRSSRADQGRQTSAGTSAPVG